jgi:hypothetical protein
LLLTSKLATTTIIPAITDSSTLVSPQTTFLTSEIAKTDKIIIPTTIIQQTSLITNAVTTTTQISTTIIAKTTTSELTTIVIAKTTTTPFETTSTTIITAISTTTTTPEALSTTSLIQTTEVIPTTSTTTPPIESTTKIIPTTSVSIATTTLKIEETSVFSTTPTLELNATSLDLTTEEEDEFTTNFSSLNESTSTPKAVLSGDSSHLDNEESNYTLFRFTNGSLSIFPKLLFSRLLRFPHEIYIIVILVLLFIILVLTIMLVCLLCKRHEAKTSLYERFVENHLVDNNYVREDSYNNSTMITRIRILGDKRASILDRADCLNERLTESKTKEEKDNDLVKNEPRLKSKKNPFKSNQTDKLEKHKRFAKLSLFSVNPVFEDDPIFENTHL